MDADPFYDESAVSLHRVDPRFVLQHPVRRAVVLDDLDEWRSGLQSAGIEVSDGKDGRPPDLAVSTVRLAAEAQRTNARSIIVEGTGKRPFRHRSYEARRILLRPSRERPTLALALEQPAPVAYALENWSVVDRRWKRARARAARTLAGRGLFPGWASPMITVATRSTGPPDLVAAARALGVPGDVTWFLTFGQGDALSRNAFQLFRPDSQRPDWVLKFARVAGYSTRFDDDERGLTLAHAAGGGVGAHVPRLVGRFDVDGIHASVETAARGRRLRDVLTTPGDRAAKHELIQGIGDWILELGRLTQAPPRALEPELERLRREIVPSYSAAVGQAVLDGLPALPAVVQHNDLGPWNVVADGADFMVVDWENARPAAFPLWDLFYFLGYAFVLLDGGADPEQMPGQIARLFAGEASSSRALFALVRRAVAASAVPPEAIGAIATLCWLSHSLSTRSHNRDIAAFAPGEAPRLHGFEGVARAWLEHPALGPSWRMWRDG